ncbi:MAG: phosphodiesterase [Solobacterium sp.]|nr:phosphodiesterase [Solobacterium sp.]
MKLMIASDIHGSAYWCAKMIEQAEKENPDKILLLGDILYHGPRNDLPDGYDPKAVIYMLNRYKNYIISIRGNCDTEVDQMVLEFPIMADYAMLMWGTRVIYATHGHIYNLQHQLPLAKGDIMLQGHTHIPAWQPYGDDNLCLNPGSVAIPKDGSPHSYMILRDSLVFFKDMEGQIYHSLQI